MSITDELREWFKDRIFMANGWQEIRDIADRIDAEHERQLEVLYRDMSDAEWMRLPKDAEGVPIHIGDVIVTTEWHKEVVEGILPERVLVLRDGEWFTIRADWCKRHAPTVEDVLRDVVTLCRNTWKEGSAFEFYDVDDVMKSGNIADFAAKLRLAEDANA